MPKRLPNYDELVKQASELYQRGETKHTLRDIAKIMGMSRSFIQRALKDAGQSKSCTTEPLGTARDLYPYDVALPPFSVISYKAIMENTPCLSFISLYSTKRQTAAGRMGRPKLYIVERPR